MTQILKCVNECYPERQIFTYEQSKKNGSKRNKIKINNTNKKMTKTKNCYLYWTTSNY